MDGIILAGGKGTRMQPLTLDTPKPLLHVQDRPILEWSLMSLHGIVDHLIVVVKYLKEQIEAYMAQQTLFTNYTLVEQLPRPMGTGHALQCCAPHLQSDDILVLNGDDLYSKTAIHELSQQPNGIFAMQRDDFERFGVIMRDADGNFSHIHEKPPKDAFTPPAPCSIGGYKFTSAIFDYELKLSARNEYEITDYVGHVAQNDHVTVVDCPFWLPIGNPQNLADAQSIDIQQWIPLVSPS